MRIHFREFIIWNSLFIIALLVLSTEIFSFFNLINQYSIKIFWFIFLLFYIYFLKRNNFIKIIKEKFNLLNFESIFILTVLTLTFIIAIIYPPNTPDAMSYHMTRVMNWIQNANINFYPTNDFRELIMGPLSSFLNLHLYLLVNGDYLTNLVQWYSMIISCLTISLISRELGCNLRYQIFSILFCVTVPMGILESTSSQTDYVATMWLTLIVYFTLKYINSNSQKYIYGFSIALGLGMLTKATVYFFSFPFCLWLGAYILLKKQKKWKFFFIIPLIVLVLNLGHFTRNVNFSGNPLGLSNEDNSFVNETFNAKSLTSNIIRNLGSNLAVPNHRINIYTIEKIEKLHDYLKISINDNRTTLPPNKSFTIFFSLYESFASNPLHLVIFFIVILLILFKKKLLSIHKYYLYSIIGGFILFCLFLKWSIWNNRYLLSFFILASPIVSYSLFKLEIKKFTSLIIIALSIWSIPYILFNQSRPLVASLKNENNIISVNKPFFLNFKREQLYYSALNFGDLYSRHYDISMKIKKSGCENIGSFFSTIVNPMTYPFWVFVKNENKLNPKIFNIEVKNNSANYFRDKFKNQKICAVVDFNNLELTLK